MDVQEPGSKVLQVSSGKPFTIHLWEDRTRGEQWVPAYEPTEFTVPLSVLPHLGRYTGQGRL